MSAETTAMPETIFLVSVSNGFMSEAGRLAIHTQGYQVDKVTEKNYIAYAVRDDGHVSASRRLIPLDIVNQRPQEVRLGQGIAFHAQFVCTEDKIPAYLELVRESYKLALLDLDKQIRAALNYLQPEVMESWHK